MEKRDTHRAKKRVMVRYGVERPERTAFTKNLSEQGMHIQTNAVVKPGTRLQVELKFPDRTFAMWGTVAWARRVPPQLAHTLPCGMGIAFIDPPAEWVEFFAKWSGKG